MIFFIGWVLCGLAAAIWIERNETSALGSLPSLIGFPFAVILGPFSMVYVLTRRFW